ncbi:MAG: radical SAM family heme chaperone HemW [Muribaculaceae bacterium]|nr:radical SAM family heme chaperone HemW [Muribaculaceae bacterium]
MAGIYVHIPFCASRCSYCDFFSTLSLKEAAEPYVEALIAEAQLRRGELQGERVKTLYMGGGTPSQLPLPLLEQLVTGLKGVLDLDGVEEFTIEANPDDVSPEWCAALPALGVNRVSMGVQSFEDEILKVIGRRHTAAQAVQAVVNLRDVGIDNISIDLIYGLPGQTLESWGQSVNQALALHPQHISAYGLTYEEGTRLWWQRQRGEVKEVPEDDCIEMYRTLVARLRKAGYEHYEISNFALPGFHSRHNSSYWDETPYLGLGAAAHSYDGAVRRNNPCDLQRYIDTIMAGKTACEQEEMTCWERYDERVMLGLRTVRGVDADRLRRDFGEQAYLHFIHEAQPHVTAGQLKRVGENCYVLTREGVILADSIIRDLMWDV